MEGDSLHDGILMIPEKKKKKGRAWRITAVQAVVKEAFDPVGKVSNGLKMVEGDLVTIIAMNDVSIFVYYWWITIQK